MMEVLKNLRDSFGEDSVFDSNAVFLAAANVIPTGSAILDDAIGCYGVPQGRITQFAGAEASGKSFLAMQVIKNWQKLNPNNWALWIDAEFSFSPQWAKTLGIDLDRLQIIKSNNAAEIFTILCGKVNSKTGKKTPGFLNNLIDVGPNHGCGVIVLDSVATMIPPVEANYDLAHQNIGPLARFLPQALRALTPLLEEANTAFIGINQVRVQPGVLYGDPTTSPGGNALKHACSLMINFAKSTSAENKIENKNKDPIGHTMLVNIQKNRFSAPRRTSLRIEYLKGIIDSNLEAMKLGCGYNVIQRPNNRTYLYKDFKWTSKDECALALKDEALQKSIFEDSKVARANGVEFGVNQAEEDLEE